MRKIPALAAVICLIFSMPAIAAQHGKTVQSCSTSGNSNTAGSDGSVAVDVNGSMCSKPYITNSVTVSANVAGSGVTIPADFVGISAETGDFTAGFYQGTTGNWTSNGFTGTAASYINTLKLLGSHGVFRIGGGSSDAATAPTITAGMSTNLNSFLAALGANWTLIYGLDLIANDTTAAATTATNIATAVGVANVIFSFGNEPGLNGFTTATYATRWNSYWTAVSGAVTNVKVAAIDDVINPGWGSQPTVIAALTPGLAGLTEVSEHWYIMCRDTFTSPVPSILIGEVYQEQFAAMSASNLGQYLINTFSYGAKPQRMTETNTICARGQSGMSDRLVAATWFLNSAMVLANYGWAGINIHSVWWGGLGIYNPIQIAADGNFIAAPIFYGMYLFSRIEGEQIIPSSVGGKGNVAAIATLGAGGNANIIAVNNDVSNSVMVTPGQSAAWSTATVLSLSGTGCSDASPTLGGQSIGESGAWTGTTTTIGNGASISIPPCGAALIKIQP